MGNKLDLGTSFGDPNLVLQFRLLTPLFISFFICISWSCSPLKITAGNQCDIIGWDLINYDQSWIIYHNYSSGWGEQTLHIQTEDLGADLSKKFQFLKKTTRNR